MFIIIGGDGKEYGPVTTEQINTWITSGRANHDTRAKAAGTDEWRRLGDFAEFGGASAGGPPPLVSSSSDGMDATAADRGLRLLAILIDRLIGLVCVLPGISLIGFTVIRRALSGQLDRFDGMDMGRVLLGVAAAGTLSLALLVVQVVMLSTRGQTIGKRLLGIRIVRFADGSKAGFVHGWLLRNFVTGIISAIPWLGLIFFFVDIGFIFRDDRRCLHDLIADTKVVKA
jgi:uncharacterized RDD family membrane protein YckC